MQSKVFPMNIVFLRPRVYADILKTIDDNSVWKEVGWKVSSAIEYQNARNILLDQLRWDAK